MLYVAREKSKGVWLVGYWDTFFTEGSYYDYAVRAKDPEDAVEFIISDDFYAFPGVLPLNEGDENLEPEWVVVEEENPEHRIWGLEVLPIDALRLVKKDEVLATGWKALEQAVTLGMGTELPFDPFSNDFGYKICEAGDYVLLAKR